MPSTQDVVSGVRNPQATGFPHCVPPWLLAPLKNSVPQILGFAAKRNKACAPQAVTSAAGVQRVS